MLHTPVGSSTTVYITQSLTIVTRQHTSIQDADGRHWYRLIVFVNIKIVELTLKMYSHSYTPAMVVSTSG